ncbi:hypothetical protein FNV43_RR06600 [Rhamnella rubrinervis]|uniref:Uncharacterized protein n=1 Tax=Rhamnella rubrinervis TaxID=2594499 RepID=A0A8K0MM47_9ROSA|nr:hypothetical protein FNV43_RR06600 [Rhamnella rubrinervis]
MENAANVDTLGKLVACYNQLSEMKEKADTEGPPMIVDEIFDIVLPLRSGYIQGRGPGPKLHSKA